MERISISMFHILALCSMKLHQQIESDLKGALKSGEKEKAGVLRFLISYLKNYQIEIKAKDKEFIENSDALAVVRRQIKQRKESIAEYEKGNRLDLAEKEKKELAILESYAPVQMNEGKIREIVKIKLQELGAVDKSAFGKLMGAVMKETQGQADGEMVKKIVEEELG
jgi:uncharacterized protein